MKQPVVGGCAALVDAEVQEVVERIDMRRRDVRVGETAERVEARSQAARGRLCRCVKDATVGVLADRFGQPSGSTICAAEARAGDLYGSLCPLRAPRIRGRTRLDPAG